MEDKEKIGEVIHYYNDIGVSVLSLSDGLAVGDEITFVSPNGEEVFTQEVASMEIDEESVEGAKKGQEVAVKVRDKAKTGCAVYK